MWSTIKLIIVFIAGVNLGFIGGLLWHYWKTIDEHLEESYFWYNKGFKDAELLQEEETNE